MKYIVQAREVHIQAYAVEADSPGSTRSLPGGE